MQNICQNHPLQAENLCAASKVVLTLLRKKGSTMKYFLPVCLVTVLFSLASKAQTVIPFDVPGGVNTEAIAISELGQVTGDYQIPNTTMVRGFLRNLNRKHRHFRCRRHEYLSCGDQCLGTNHRYLRDECGRYAAVPFVPAPAERKNHHLRCS